MKNIQLLAFAILAMLLSAVSLAAQCQMVYRVSVYTDGSVSSDLSTVYGYTNAVDNSTLCSYSHYNYQMVATIYAPDGSHASSAPQSGFQANVSKATNGQMGIYQQVGTESFYCTGAAATVYAGGGSSFDVLPNVSLTVSSTDMNVGVNGKSVSFTVDASASGGFSTPISGSMTVDQPVKPQGMQLVDGSHEQTKQFTLSAGGTTSPNQTLTFTISTNVTNTVTGDVVYVVQIDPSDSYNITSSTSPHVNSTTNGRIDAGSPSASAFAVVQAQVALLPTERNNFR